MDEILKLLIEDLVIKLGKQYQVEAAKNGDIRTPMMF